MPWWLFEMDEGLVGEYATKRAALADPTPIWKVRRLKAGVYEVYCGFAADDHDGPWWLYGSRALARADGWEVPGGEVMARRKKPAPRRTVQRITLAECHDAHDRLRARIEAHRTTVVAGSRRLTVKCFWFDPSGNPLGEELLWVSTAFGVALLDAFTAQAHQEGSQGMTLVSCSIPRHGFYQTTTASFDRTINTYLPASPNELSPRIQERTGGELDASDVPTVTELLFILAELDGRGAYPNEHSKGGDSHE